MSDSRGKSAAALVWLLAGLAGLLYLTLSLLSLMPREEAQDPGLLLGLVVSGSLTGLLLIVGLGLAAGGNRRFDWRPGGPLALFLLCLAAGKLVLASGQTVLIGLLMPALHLAGVLLPGLIILAWARGKVPPGPPAARVAERDAESADLEMVGESGAEADAGHEHGRATGRDTGGELTREPPFLSLPPAPVAVPIAVPGAELSWRSLMAGLAWGGCGATFLAIVLEGIAALALVLGLVLILGDDPIWRDLQQGFSLEGGAAPDAAAQQALLLRLVENPWLVGAVLVMLAALAPLFEEAAKVLGLAFSSSGGASGGARGNWLRGLALGAGFGVFEGVFYAGMALTPLTWIGAVVLRACATFMHATVTGLAALGWWRGRSGRWGSALALLGAAVVGHGLWNGLALGAVVASLRAGGESGGQPVGPLAAALAGGVIVLFYGMVLVFGVISRRLRVVGAA